MGRGNPAPTKNRRLAPLERGPAFFMEKKKTDVLFLMPKFPSFEIPLFFEILVKFCYLEIHRKIIKL
jgi:hypothetical protein